MNPIRLGAVLLIVNSSIAQSSTDAANYATQRSLTGGHVLAFNFGSIGANEVTLATLRSNASITCQTPPYVGQSFLAAVTNYRLAHLIDAIIVSTWTPANVTGFIAPYTQAVYMLGAMAAASHWWLTNDLNAGHFYNSPVNPITIEEIIDYAPQDWYPGTFPGANPDNPKWIAPHGRLGAANWISADVTEITLRPSIGAESIYTHAVAQAKAAELYDHTNEIHCFTDVLGYSIINPDINQKALNYAQRLTMIQQRNMGTAAYPMTAAGGGSISAGGPIFALSLAVNFNLGAFNFGGPLADSFTCAPGAWGFVWTSGAGQAGGDFLYNGAGAAVMSGHEPYADGIPTPEGLFILAAHYQIPLMLAHLLAKGNAMGSAVYGDPLYAPYLSTNVNIPKPWRMPYS